MRWRILHAPRDEIGVMFYGAVRPGAERGGGGGGVGVGVGVEGGWEAGLGAALCWVAECGNG